jgi:hypothetical protein
MLLPAQEKAALPKPPEMKSIGLLRAMLHLFE